MTAKFRQVTDDFWVAPQISEADIAEATVQGFTLIINNRPDAEESGQPCDESLKTVATAAGLGWAHIPVDANGISHPHLDAFAQTRTEFPGKTLAYCRSGTRSAFIGAYAAARSGRDIDQIISETLDAGYDISGHRPILEQLRPGTNKA